MSDKLKAAKNTAWKWFSLFIRLRDAFNGGYVKCCTCSTIKHYKEMQAGHFFSQGANRRIVFDLQNCHTQCVSCNMYKSGNLGIYSGFLADKYGNNIFTELAKRNITNKKYQESDYREMADTYRIKVNKLKNKLQCE